VSARSRQAQHLARQLASRAGLPVDVAYDGTRAYLIQWGDGPTADQMSALVTAELATGQYPDLPAALLTSSRGYTARAFAARAAAARRDGSLASAIRAGVATRQRLGIQHPSWSTLSDADCAAHDHIERLLDVTAYPDRADEPADEPVIASLIEASGGNEYAMLPALLQAGHHAKPDNVPAAGISEHGEPEQTPEPRKADGDHLSSQAQPGTGRPPTSLSASALAPPSNRAEARDVTKQPRERDNEPSPYESRSPTWAVVTWMNA